MDHEAKTLSLPFALVGPSDLSRLKRELNELNETMLQLELRREGEDQVKLPKTSRILDQLVEINDVNLLSKDDREKLAAYLEQISENAPTIHMSFSVDPSAIFLEKLIKWLRNSIDENILVTIGLEPSIGAGCIVRTKNKYFDLSLKQTLVDKRETLVKQLLKDMNATGEKAEAST